MECSLGLTYKMQNEALKLVSVKGTLPCQYLAWEGSHSENANPAKLTVLYIASTTSSSHNWFTLGDAETRVCLAGCNASALPAFH
ncbi:hypothetical protein pipiens_013180 [Culex pipiens pipiens]|uniref:Uncharacterized protein n=1 Tax=Culex pipiens pipiens TaxID=38569 RepID=A0ABD1D0J7_CULPP